MAGRVRFLRKSSRGDWARRLRDWLQAIWLRTAAPPRGDREQRHLAIRWKTQPPIAQQHPGRGLVLKGSELHCPACGMPLTEESETVTCSLDSSHVVHAKCSRYLVKGKCPRDGGALQAAS